MLSRFRTYITERENKVNLGGYRLLALLVPSSKGEKTKQLLLDAAHTNSLTWLCRARVGGL